MAACFAMRHHDSTATEVWLTQPDRARGATESALAACAQPPAENMSADGNGARAVRS